MTEPQAAARAATPEEGSSPKPRQASSPRSRKSASPPTAPAKLTLEAEDTEEQGPVGELQPPELWVNQGLPENSDTDSAFGDDAASSTASISSSILKYRSINGRTYHSDRDVNHYWGTNDELGKNTLDIQHHVFTLILDGKLAAAPLPDHVDKVLDIGTGTGAWAIDYADLHPETQVIGTDLSPIQPTWVPPNVQFQIDDFNQPWTYAEGTFDYIHARWLVGSVPDWEELFRQAYRALKPGGWIETLDTNAFFESDDGTVTETTAAGQWAHIFLGGFRKLGSKASVSIVLDKLQRKALEAAGFINIQETLYKIPFSEWAKDEKQREIGLYARATFENDIEGSVGLMASMIGWTPEQISVYSAHLRKDMRSLKVHAYYRANLAIAQKPF